MKPPPRNCKPGLYYIPLQVKPSAVSLVPRVSNGAPHTLAVMPTRLTLPSTGALLHAPAGTVLVTVADGQAPAPQGDALLRVLGDTLTLISAALYAGYTVSLRKDLPGEESAQQVAFFFGWLGVYSCAMVGPLLLLAVVLGWVDVAGIPAKSYGIIFGEGGWVFACRAMV